MKNLLRWFAGIFAPNTKHSTGKTVKYIVIKHPQFDCLNVPVVFSDALLHKDIAKGFEVVSAGFYSSKLGAHGQSFSLGVVSNPKEDNYLIGSLTGWEL